MKREERDLPKLVATYAMVSCPRVPQAEQRGIPDARSKTEAED